MGAKETKDLAYRILAKNRYARRPSEIPPKQWSAIKSVMERRFMREFMDSPEGLYTDEQIWKQTFKKFTMAHEIEILEVGKAGNGLYLQYEIDGKQYDCTGEFYIDKNGTLHHTHIMPDGEEVEITCQYFADGI